jgi:nicotinate-nucleotide--dimethylbenzimidazole phosphoribosyltransferase
MNQEQDVTEFEPIDIPELCGRIERPDQSFWTAAKQRQETLTKPSGALGKLEDLSAWLCSVQGQCPPRPLDRVRVVIFAGDHGIARTAQTSAYPPEVTAQMVMNFVTGGAAVNVLARQNNASVRIVDMAVDADYDALGMAVPADVTRYKVCRSSGSIDREDALTYEQAQQAFAAGVAIANEEIDAGVDLLIPGDMGIGNTTPASTIIALYTNLDAASAVGRGTGIDDLTWMRKTTAVRDAMRRAKAVKADPLKLLAAVGGADIAAMTGFLMGASARKTPVLLDGIVSTAAGLLAQRYTYRATEWWQAGHRSTEPAQQKALDQFPLVPIVDYELRLGEGTGALIALPVLRAAGNTLREMSTFDEAGVSDRDSETAESSDTALES